MLKRTKIIATAMAAAMMLSVLATGCTGKSASKSGSSGSGKVNITFLNSKGEIAKQLEAAAKVYNSSNKDGITVTVFSVSSSSTVDETMLTKYASGNPCTLNMVDPLDITAFAAKSADLSNEKWVSDINPSLVSQVKYNGKIMAFPLAVEGYGLIYNKTTVEKATGAKFVPSSIKNLSDLENLYKKIQAGGVTPVEISHDDWSLASHFLAVAYATQSEGYEAYYKQLKAGTADISKNETYNGLLKLLDLNKKYNIYKNSPMSSDYNTSDPQNIATGKVAFWFNGVWVWPNVSQFLTGTHAKDEFGFLPLFADSKTSNSIISGGTKFILVDKVKATAEQQKAANKFLNWLVYDSKGQSELVNEMGIIPAFKNITLEPKNSLAKSNAEYMKAGKTILSANQSGNYYKSVGVFMQEYLTGKIDKATLSKSINNYFTTASWVK